MTHTVQFRKGGTRIEFDLPDMPFAGNAFIPSTAVIPLSQASAESASPIVSVGDRIREGQLIARGPVPVHAPIPGMISSFRRVPLPDGNVGQAAVIELSGSFDITGRKSANNVWRNIPTADVCRLIEDRGVVNAFDEARPLARDLKKAREREKAVLVCRLFDIDPTSPLETSILRERGQDVWEGFAIVAAAMRASSVVLVFADGGSSTVPDEARLKEMFGEARVSAIAVKNRYPTGSEYRLTKLVSEKVTGIQASAAVYCDAVTALAVFEAIVRDIPPITVNLLVIGSAIAKPRFLRVRTGTLIGDLIEECGGFKDSPARIVVNGLIRGTALYDLDTPVTRYTRSLHVMDRDACPSFRVMDCAHCGACLSACPSGLDPIGTVVAIRNRVTDAKVKKSIAACERCGCCSMVCPSRIPIHHEIAGGMTHD